MICKEFPPETTCLPASQELQQEFLLNSLVGWLVVWLADLLAPSNLTSRSICLTTYQQNNNGCDE